MKYSGLQPTPFMNVLRVEQVMDIYEVRRKIESANKTKSIQIRFYALGNGEDVWIDGESFSYFGADMENFLESKCEISREDAEKLGSTWDVVAVEGFVEELCMSEKGVFSWSNYEDALDALKEYSEDVLQAAKDADIRFDKISDCYHGKYDKFSDYVKQSYLDSTTVEPKSLIAYIDWDSMAEDWDVDYIFQDGHVFRNC